MSSVGTRSGDSFRSPTDQAATIQRWADGRGVSVHILPPELDESGGRQDRPLLLQAVEAIEAGQYEGLVFAYLSRAGRSLRHLLEMWDRIEAAGGSVVSVAEQIDTSGPAGRLQRNLHGSFAEYELDQYKERFAHAKDSATRRGIWQARVIPLGYVKDPETRRLVPGVDAPLVVKAFESRAARVPVSHIALDLRRTNAGTRHLLKNRVYLGEVRKGEFVNPEAHEPIISRDLFDTVAALRGVRPARSKSESLLAGMIRCQGCGFAMRRGKSNGHVTYSCHREHSAGRCPYPASIIGARVERLVEAVALEFLQRMTIDQSDRTDKADSLRAELSAAESELGAYLQAVAAADIGAEAFREAARQRKQRVDEARAALESHMVVAPIGGALRDGVSAWESLSIQDRNTVLRGLIDAVVVRRAGRGRPAISERVRIFAKGTLPRSGHTGESAIPLSRLPFPDLHDERVLWVSGCEDSF